MLSLTLCYSENESEDISVCSEEERDIMAEIRAEITQKVREEMKSELEVYDKARANLNKDKDQTEDDLAGCIIFLCSMVSRNFN